MREAFRNFFPNIAENFLAYPVLHILDIVLFAVFLYIIMSFLKRNHAMRLVFIIVPLVLLSAFFQIGIFRLPVMSGILGFMILFLAFAPMVLFPNETKRFLHKISASKESKAQFNTVYNASDEELMEAIESIVRSTQNMAKKNTGGLIIIAPDPLPSHILESGVRIDGKVSSSLIETIFHERTPLHDGAMCVHGNQIVAAGCFLPLSQSLLIDKDLGTRHRAAIGITETHNVYVIVVSEETGVISAAKNGELKRYYDAILLRDELMQIYGLKAVAHTRGAYGR